MGQTRILTLKAKRIATTMKVRADGDPKSRKLTFTIATERQATDGGVLIADGMDTKDYVENPVVLCGHDHNSRMGVTREIRRVEGGWEADVEIASDAALDDNAKRTLAFIREFGVGAASIGFVVTEMDRDPQADELAKYGASSNGWIGRKWKLLEWSIVAVPADQSALLKMADGNERRAMARAFSEIGQQRAFRFMRGSIGMVDEHEDDKPVEETETNKDGSEEADASDATAKLVEAMAKHEQMLAQCLSKLDEVAAKLDQGASAEEAESEADSESGESAADLDEILNAMESVKA